MNHGNYPSYLQHPISLQAAPDVQSSAPVAVPNPSRPADAENCLFCRSFSICFEWDMFCFYLFLGVAKHIDSCSSKREHDK